MKPEEMMLGDWISFNGEPVKVQQVVSGINELDYEPIPLTPEILEKNGFVRSSVFVEWKYERNGIYMLWKPFPWLQISTNEAEVKNECEYVHELQHALRLCGIDKEIVL